MGSLLRFFGGFSSLLPVVVVLTSSAARADEEHSWCIPGSAKDPNGSSVQQVNTIVQNVCGLQGFGYCCDRGSGQGKWDLACIQQGSFYAFNVLNQDVCGRYAWSQGPVADGHSDQQQYYPRDFSLFAVGGSVSGITDVQGPVGAAGAVTARSFSLNSSQQEGLGLITQSNLSLSNGTVFGNAVYGNNYTSENVTYNNGNFYIEGPGSFPINFGATKANLENMSLALLRYPTTPNATAQRDSNNNNKVVFRSTDPDLNVFTIVGSLLTGTTIYEFDVPSRSTVIVNVSASDPVIVNAGFAGASGNPIGLRNMLWNFPNATTLTIQSTGFPASILAPHAAATLRWGAITGTVVVWSAIVDAELHVNPFRMPGCGGCLCLDPDWSCSNETTVDDSGIASRLGPEAGFLFIGGGDYTAENTTRYAPDHRIWYSFRPADVRPKEAPLAVFFNGGPGSATSTVLFAWGTGPVKFVDQYGDGKSVAMQSNAHSWTQFANLLYIDAPATGFSYPLPHPGNQANDVGIDIDEDAGIFLRVIVNFLKRHPYLSKNGVILVGESYGGTRATLMLNYLYNYDKIKSGGGGAYQDQRVYDDLTNVYFPAALSTSQPSVFQIAGVFGHQVLIDPVVAGKEQSKYYGDYPPQNCLPPSSDPDPRNPRKCWMSWQRSGSPPTVVSPTCDPYNCDKPLIDGVYWSNNLQYLVAAKLTIPIWLTQILGVDPSTIGWMKASARSQAFGRDSGKIATPSQTWLNMFGHNLAPGDNYFLVLNHKANDSYGCMRDQSTGECTGTRARDYSSAGADVGADFLVNASRVATLITVTKHDGIVPSPAIAEGLNDGNPSFNQYLQTCPQPPGVPCGVSYRPTDATSCSLPGKMVIAYDIGGITTLGEVVMPTAYEAGHSVTMRDGDNFMADVQGWYRSH